MHVTDLCSDELGTWRTVAIPEEKTLYLEYEWHGDIQVPPLRMTIDDFLFTWPRTASHQRAADAFIALARALVERTGTKGADRGCPGTLVPRAR